MVPVRKEAVLYVEDEPVNVMLMRLLFERRPQLQLEVATSVEEVERVAAGLHAAPALMLLDLRLPDGHGAELLRQLRRREGWEHVPAIAVTAETGFDTKGTGFADLWRKPLNPSALLSRLDELLPPGRRGDAANTACTSSAAQASAAQAHWTPRAACGDD